MTIHAASILHRKADFLKPSYGGCIDDAESGYHRAIDILEDDVQDVNTRKRTLDYLKEGMTLLRACKRQFVSNRTASPTPLSTTSFARKSRSPPPANSLPESSSHLQTIPSEQPPSIYDSVATSESCKNWRYHEAYMAQI
ncbi:hypothetical protein INT43_004883 [Umbelopsis isabellina]|uniref:Uncharacterized protein n=1 Tax=Mortierella isabellina TaxID=91625 RepID=A0A8H7U6X7_MORIS|nr:hypothetical protein INT43_004883 [Umbelopsis isabellina]